MADFTLRVTPEVLKQRADEFSTMVANIQTHFEQIEETSSQTRGYWLGDAGDRDREGYASYKEDIAFVLKRLKEHPVDLLKMAGIYEEREQENIAVIEELPTNNLA